MLKDIINLRDILKEKKITFIYSGPLWAEGIGSMAEALKRKLELDKITLNTKQEIFSVFAEQMNNMLMYSAEKEEFKQTDDIKTEYPKGTFILGKEGKTYFIQTGNLMKNSGIELIKSRIDYLNTLDKDALRKYYKEQVRYEDDNPESKGAGLGLIEIARRINGKMEYSFTPYNDELTFYSLYVAIEEKKD